MNYSQRVQVFKEETAMEKKKNSLKLSTSSTTPRTLAYAPTYQKKYRYPSDSELTEINHPPKELDLVISKVFERCML